LRRLLIALEDPRKNSLIVGNVIKEIDKKYENKPLSELITGKTIFSTEEIKETINLAIAAFERGDYDKASERAESAQLLLLLERKYSPSLFMYLYWHIVLIFLIFLIISGVFGRRTYKKISITKKIEDINKEEENIKTLFVQNQKKYYSGKISSNEFHRIEAQNNNRIANIRKKRINLRNKRVKILTSQKVQKDLELERSQIQKKIKEIQTQYYKNKKISESEYKLQFKSLNERLAEIEDERTTLLLLEKTKKPKRKKLPKKTKKT